MSDKISALPTGTTLATGDLFPVTDVSDISETASGKTKKYTLTLIYNYLKNTLANFVSTNGNPSTGSLVPPVASGSSSNFLNSLGAWATPPNTTYSVMNVSNSYVAGLVPTGAEHISSDLGKFLRIDGTFTTVLSSAEHIINSGLTVEAVFDDVAAVPSITVYSGYILVISSLNGIVTICVDLNVRVTTATVNQIFDLNLNNINIVPPLGSLSGTYKGTGNMKQTTLTSGGSIVPVDLVVESPSNLRIQSIKIPTAVTDVYFDISGIITYQA